MKIIGYSVFALYFIIIWIIPIFAYCFDWDQIIKFWIDWQTLTAAMIAFFASIVIYHATQIKEEKQRQRNFIAVSAFLPDAFSKIIAFCDESLNTYKNVLDEMLEETTKNKQDLKRDIPTFPIDTFKTIKESMSFAPDDFSSYLARILVLIQIFEARMEGNFQYSSNNKNYIAIVSRSTILSEIFLACRIKAMISNIFKYVRNEGDFKDVDPDFSDLMRSFRTAGLVEDNELTEFFENHKIRSSKD
jgi:hypothetical protein